MLELRQKVLRNLNCILTGFKMVPNNERLVLKWAFLFFNFLQLFMIMNLQVTDAARILGLFASPAPSHNIMFNTLMKALAEHGHTVEVASPYPFVNPKPVNYTGIELPIPNINRQEMLDLLVSPDQTPLKEQIALWSVAEVMCDVQLSSPELQKYLTLDPNSPKIDLVIAEVFFYDCLAGFANHFNVPLVAMISQFAVPWSFDLVGNPTSYSFVPNLSLKYGQKMSFFERLHNTFFSIGMKLYRRYISLPKQYEVAKRYFGYDMPPLWEIERRTSLVLSNGHPAVSPFYPAMPNMINVAGMHIQSNPPPLSKDMLQILNNNEKVILFSLGSIIDSTAIKDDRLIVIVSALKEIPYPVLWRWDGSIDKLPVSLPSNVYVYKWLPQQSLLAHPNLVGFLTHGGLLSLQEATYHGVPIIGFPFYGDQFANLKHASDVGMGFSLSFFTVTKEELVDSINKIMNDPSYSRNAKKLSTIFRDQQETPLERGVYWVEYILRHRGAPHLRSAAMDLTWFQYYLIDITVFVFFVFGLSCALLYYIFIKCLCTRGKKVKKE